MVEYNMLAQRLMAKIKEVRAAEDVLRDAKYDLDKEKEAVIQALVEARAFRMLSINMGRLMRETEEREIGGVMGKQRFVKKVESNRVFTKEVF
jgi:hypothetical protein